MEYDYISQIWLKLTTLAISSVHESLGTLKPIHSLNNCLAVSIRAKKYAKTLNSTIPLVDIQS